MSGRRSHAHSQSLTGSSRTHAPALVLEPRRSTGGNCALGANRHPDNDTKKEEEEGQERERKKWGAKTSRSE